MFIFVEIFGIYVLICTAWYMFLILFFSCYPSLTQRFFKDFNGKSQIQEKLQEIQVTLDAQSTF